MLWPTYDFLVESRNNRLHIIIFYGGLCILWRFVFSNTKYITFDNRKYRMNKETTKGKQRKKVVGALFAHATALGSHGIGEGLT